MVTQPPEAGHRRLRVGGVTPSATVAPESCSSPHTGPVTGRLGLGGPELEGDGGGLAWLRPRSSSLWAGLGVGEASAWHSCAGLEDRAVPPPTAQLPERPWGRRLCVLSWGP